MTMVYFKEIVVSMMLFFPSVCVTAADPRPFRSVITEARILAYKTFAPWSLTGDPDKDHNVMLLEIMRDMEVLTIREIESDIFGKDTKYFQVRVLSDGYLLSSTGPVYRHHAVVYRDGKLTPLKGESEIVESFHTPSLARIEDVAALIRIFCSLCGLELLDGEPTQDLSMLPDETRKTADWSISFSREPNGWEIKFSAIIANGSERIVRFRIRIREGKAKILERKIVSKGWSSI